MAHDQQPDQALDADELAYVAEQSLLAVRLDSEADRSPDAEQALRLHATADQARALADIEIKLGQIRRAASGSSDERSPS